MTNLSDMRAPANLTKYRSLSHFQLSFVSNELKMDVKTAGDLCESPAATLAYA
jgi:hypothetical protein